MYDEKIIIIIFLKKPKTYEYAVVLSPLFSPHPLKDLLQEKYQVIFR